MYHCETFAFSEYCAKAGFDGLNVSWEWRAGIARPYQQAE